MKWSVKLLGYRSVIRTGMGRQNDARRLPAKLTLFQGKTLREDRSHLPLFIGISLMSFGIWWCFSPISYNWGADMVAVIKVAEQFSKNGIFPVKGILSSVAAYNMPGLVWLVLPASLIFSDPSAIAMATAIPLNILAAFILFKLAARSMHRNLAFACMIIYCLSPLTFQASRSLWAQHYLGPFYIFIAYFLTKWAIDRKALYGPAAIIFIVYATMIHFSAVVLLGVWGVVWLLWRPPMRFSGLLLALFISTILLSPYLCFQMERGFQDLKAFVVGKSLLDHQLTTLEHSVESTTGGLSVTIKSWGLSAVGAPKGLLQLLLANFLPVFRRTDAISVSFSIYQGLLGIFFIGGFGSIFFQTIKTIGAYFRSFRNNEKTKSLKGVVSLFDEREQSYWMLLILIMIPLLIMAFMGYNQRKSFAFPFFPFQCITGFLFLDLIHSSVLSKARIKRIVSIAIAVMLVVIQCSAFCLYIFYSTIGGHSTGLDEEKFLQRRIANFIVNDMKSNNLQELLISYDIVKERKDWNFIAKYHLIDPIYQVGMEFNYFLEKYPEIFLPPPAADGLRSDARYVIVFQEGAKRYDLTSYMKYDFEQFAVLIERRPEKIE